MLTAKILMCKFKDNIPETWDCNKKKGLGNDGTHLASKI